MADPDYFRSPFPALPDFPLIHYFYPVLQGTQAQSLEPHYKTRGYLIFLEMSSSSSSSSGSPYWHHGTASQTSQEEFDPENIDMTFSRQRERRYTTITLREIRYPLGCPCHPADPEAAKKQRYRAPSPDSRPSYIYHSRPELTPRTESQDSTASDTSQTSRGRFGSLFRRVSNT